MRIPRWISYLFLFSLTVPLTLGFITEQDILATVHRYIWPYIGYLLESQGGFLESDREESVQLDALLDLYYSMTENRVDYFFIRKNEENDGQVFDYSRREPLALLAEEKGWRRRRDQARHRGLEMHKPVPPNQGGNPNREANTNPGTGPSYHDSPDNIVFQDPIFDAHEGYHVRFLRVMGDVFTRWSQLVTMIMDVVTEPISENEVPRDTQNQTSPGTNAPNTQSPVPTRPARRLRKFSGCALKSIIEIISALQYAYIWNELIQTIRLLVSLLPEWIRQPIDLFIQFITPLANLLQWLFGWIYRRKDPV